MRAPAALLLLPTPASPAALPFTRHAELERRARRELRCAPPPPGDPSPRCYGNCTTAPHNDTGRADLSPEMLGRGYSKASGMEMSQGNYQNRC
eukprot:gene37157-48374_t